MHRCALAGKQSSRTHIVGARGIYKEERVLEERKKIDNCDLEAFGTLVSIEKT